MNHNGFPGDAEFRADVSSNSMEPAIMRGDHIYFTDGGEYAVNDVLVVSDGQDKSGIFRLKERDGRRILIMDNPDFPGETPYIPARVIGKVVKVRREVTGWEGPFVPELALALKTLHEYALPMGPEGQHALGETIYRFLTYLCSAEAKRCGKAGLPVPDDAVPVLSGIGLVVQRAFNQMPPERRGMFLSKIHKLLSEYV